MICASYPPSRQDRRTCCRSRCPFADREEAGKSSPCATCALSVIQAHTSSADGGCMRVWYGSPVEGLDTGSSHSIDDVSTHRRSTSGSAIMFICPIGYLLWTGNGSTAGCLGCGSRAGTDDGFCGRLRCVHAVIKTKMEGGGCSVSPTKRTGSDDDRCAEEGPGVVQDAPRWSCRAIKALM